MSTIVLLHWKEEELQERAGRIADYRVKPFLPAPGEGIKGLRTLAPFDALVISLDRLPSHGRDVGYAFHMQKPTRDVPLVYVGGDPAKVAKIRELLPEASYCSWEDVDATIARALASPAVTPPKAGRVFAETPVQQKLGLKRGMHLALLGAPAPLEELVPDLPADLHIHEAPSAQVEMTLWFARSAEEVEADLPDIARALGKKPRLWIFYQKGRGLTWTGISETAGLHGLAQFKILRLNETWAGVAFGRSRT